MKEKIFNLLEIHCASMSVSTKSTYRGIVKEWRLFLKARNFEGATVADVWEYVFYLQNKTGIKSRIDGSVEFSQRTIKKNIDCLRGFYRYLKDIEVIKTNPFDKKEFRFKVKQMSQKRPIELLPYEKIKKLLNTPDAKTKKGVRDRALLTAKFATGARVSEVTSIVVGDIKMSPQGQYYITIRRGKGNKQRVQTLPDWAMPDLLKIIEQRRKEGAKSQCFIFVSYGTTPEVPGSARLHRRYVYQLFVNYIKRAGLENIYSPHSARATAITKLLVDGEDYRYIQDFSGHASIEMVVAYDKRRTTLKTCPGKNLKYH